MTPLNRKATGSKPEVSEPEANRKNPCKLTEGNTHSFRRKRNGSQPKFAAREGVVRRATKRGRPAASHGPARVPVGQHAFLKAGFKGVRPHTLAFLFSPARPLAGGLCASRCTSLACFRLCKPCPGGSPVPAWPGTAVRREALLNAGTAPEQLVFARFL
jgi:hypothetical protein